MTPPQLSLPFPEPEEWRSINGFLGYEVSNLGNVRTFRVSDRWHPGAVRALSRPVTLHVDKKWGYWHFGPRTADGKRINLLIHIVVATAFLGPCPDGYEVNHKDGDKTNNCSTNLEYVTSSENQKHAYSTGLQVAKQGEEASNAKLTVQQVKEIRLARKNGILLTTLAAHYGVTFQVISSIARRKTWKSVT